MNKWSKKRLTAQVFDLAVKRLSASGRSYVAARLVMVDGTSIAQACRIASKSTKKPLARQVVYKAIERIEKSFATLKVCPYCGHDIPEV